MLSIQHVKKVYDTGTMKQTALDDVSITFRNSEFVSILGPSGSGKTTLLNIIGGLDRYDEGDLIIDGVSTKNYKERDWDTYRNHTIGFVFQSYNLIAHQTILSNVELALTISGMPVKERREKAKEALIKVGLGNHLQKRPSELSGGQMQRVAIARALVNDPKIVLADEPTGALDSETSVAIMEILKEIAEDRLVVMVTHNPDLADQYTQRIVRIKDGHIIEDSDPCHEQDELLDEVPYVKKSSMSFLTALSLSFNNLRTKKARTFLVSFAGSIGIIGIALILALSSGVNLYIENLEEKTLSQYPMTISSSNMDLTEMLGGTKQKIKKGYVGESQSLSNMLSGATENDLDALRSYMKSNATFINKNTNDVEYHYDVSPLVLRKNGKKILQVSPYKPLSDAGLSGNMTSMLGFGSTDTFRSLPHNKNVYKDQYQVKAGHWPQNENEMVVVLDRDGTLSDLTLYSLGLKNMKTLDDMLSSYKKGKPSTKKSKPQQFQYSQFLNRQYTILPKSSMYTYSNKQKTYVSHSDQAYLKKQMAKGKQMTIVGIVAPKDKSQGGMLSEGVLYDAKIGDEMIREASQSDVVKAQLKHKKTNVFTNESFGKSNMSKALSSSSLFKVDQNALKNAFQINTSSLKNMSNFKIDSNALSSSLNASDLSKMMPKLDMNSLLSKVKFKIPEKEGQELMSSIVTGYGDYLKTHKILDEEMLQKTLTNFLNSSEFKEAVQSNQTNITTDHLNTLINQMLNDVVTDYVAYAKTQANPLDTTNNMKNYQASAQYQNVLKKELESLQKLYTPANNEQMMKAISTAFTKSMKKTSLPTNKQLSDAFMKYISSDSVSKKIMNLAKKSISTKDLEKSLAQQTKASQKAMTQSMNAISKAIATQISKSFASMMKNPQDLMKIDPTALGKSLKMNLNEEDLKSLMSSLMNGESTTYDDNLKSLGYVTHDDLSEIVIYPKNFDSKKNIEKMITNYNHDMKAKGLKKKMISYTDTTGIILKNFTSMVNTISLVLVALVAISLVVSSIMIGVITYISVLERRKEIGILRSIGASRGNVAQVFNAETIITGALSGLIGIGISEALMPFMTKIVQALSKRPDLTMHLPFTYALMLIGISIVLTFIGGLIPSSKASRSDPVTALRSSD